MEIFPIFALNRGKDSSVVLQQLSHNQYPSTGWAHIQQLFRFPIRTHPIRNFPGRLFSLLERIRLPRLIRIVGDFLTLWDCSATVFDLNSVLALDGGTQHLPETLHSG